MDPEKRARRQSLRIIVSECFMVLAVVVTVAILAFIVSGYWVNSDFKVERQGMLQISSLPTGAEVIVDNETAWNQRTNTSKVLSSGEHTIELKKDGYDTWSRTINITEGLLYRVHYPRLFLKERTKEELIDFSAVSYASVSPNREHMLMINNTTEWKTVDLTRDKLEPKTIDVSKIFSSVSLAPGAEKGLFNGNILGLNWSTNNEKILIEASVDNKTEWVILNIKNPSDSKNLTNLFNLNFSRINIADDSASSLLALVDGDLRKISLDSLQISAILAENVVDFDYRDSEIVFSAEQNDETQPKYYVGLLKNHGDDAEIISRFDTVPFVTISRFYDDDYIAIITNGTLEIFEKKDKKPYLNETVSTEIKDFAVGHEGEFQTAVIDNSHIVTIDMEAKSVVEWQTEGNFAWLDSDMIYSVKDGDLIVYDFDGLNRRLIAKNVSSHFPVTITSDKWLYYVSDNSLVREKIVE